MRIPHGDCKVIASIDFDLLLESGERRAIKAWIGEPFLTEHGHAACPCGLDALGPDHVGIFGEDLMQALCLAIAFLHRRLSDELGRHTLFHAGTPEKVNQEYIDVLFSR